MSGERDIVSNVTVYLILNPRFAITETTGQKNFERDIQIEKIGKRESKSRREEEEDRQTEERNSES